MVGIGMGAVAASKERSVGANLTLIAGLFAVSALPDLDVLAFALGIPYEHTLGHRGFGHSASFAVIASLAFFFLTQLSMRLRGTKKIGPRELAVFFLVALSHPLLDMLTNGGLGCALFSPFSSERHFFPWQPIPVSPIGLTARVLPVVAWEARFAAPLALAFWTGRCFLRYSNIRRR